MVKTQIMANKLDFSLYVVTDSRLVGEKSLESVIQLALKGGATMIQYREKNKEANEIYAKALVLKNMCNKFGVPLIINDRLDIAMAIDADGIHIGQKDLPIAEVRKLFGPHKIIGFTVENEAQVVLSNGQEVDYYIAAPVFRTNTKLDDRGLLGIEGLKSMIKVSKKPVIAAGGISLKNAADVMDLGSAGIVVVNQIMSGEDPKLISEKFIKILKPKGI